jgi:adenine-specific DNA methylase
VPDHEHRRFNIEIVAGASAEQLTAASAGTISDGDVTYTLEGETYRTQFKTIRGDARLSDGRTGNKLRPWDRTDFIPRPDDILQERLYCIQWITRDTLNKSRQETFFASITDEDLAREQKVEHLVRESLPCWQTDGLVPDMPIELGEETTRLIRERGWTHWHHLFGARHLLILAKIRGESRQSEQLINFCQTLNISSRLNMINSSAG